jgi:hypothetical protein
MRQSILLAVLVAACSAIAMPAAGAQGFTNSCPPGTVAGGIPDADRASQDACQMAVDVFQLMAPQLGLALAGGNATLGRGSTLGPGHFSIGLRGNVFEGDLPQVNDFPTPGINGRVQRTGANALPGKKQVIGLPTADAAIGIFGGVPLGLTSVGGIDLLVSATYVPEIGDATDDVQIKPDRSLQLGYGVRVGLLQESLVVPGVSFTYLKRDLPRTDIFGTSSTIDVNITDASVKTSAFRLVASKSLMLFGIAAGIGQDRYDQTATIQATVKSNVLGVPATFTSDEVLLGQKMTRTNYFVDLSLNLPVIKLIAEVGQVTGGKTETYNEFATGSPAKSRPYGSLGLRVAW